MTPRGRRAGDAGHTREAILGAARALFAEVGYERATLRAIAARAEVDAALIHHYFGSKEGLLVAAVVPPVDFDAALEGVGDGSEPLGHDLVRRMVTVWATQAEVVNRTVALVRTALTSDHAAHALRDQMVRTVVPILTRLAAEDDRELRVSLVMSQMSGLFVIRQVARIPPLAQSSTDQVVAAVGPTVHRYLTGDLRPASSGRRSARG